MGYGAGKAHIKTFISFSAAFIIFFAGSPFAAEPVNQPGAEEFSIVKRSSDDFKEVKNVIDQIIVYAEEGDLDGIVNQFSKRYLNSGRDRSDVRKQWRQILENFSELELTHPIYGIEMAGDFAKIKCEGILLGKPSKPGLGERYRGDSVVIDSWKFSVHYLIREDGRWKILGDQIPYGTGRTFHPLF